MPASDTETCLLFLRFSRKLPGTRRGIIFRENWVPSVSKHYSFNNFYRRVEMCAGPYPEPSPVAAVRFNSQHPRKIIRGSGREEGVRSAKALSPPPPSAQGLCHSVAAAPPTQGLHIQTRGPWLHRTFGSTDFQAQTSQTTHPQRSAVGEAAPAQSVYLGGPAPGAPSLPASWLPSSPGLGLDPQRWPREPRGA